jgi:hypothetical protein
VPLRKDRRGSSRVNIEQTIGVPKEAATNAQPAKMDRLLRGLEIHNMKLKPTMLGNGVLRDGHLH